MLNHQLTTESSSDKAWHILALLISMGRPATLAEISSRCTLFHATPDLIHCLCQIPYSPISLTNDFSVTLSTIAFLSFTEFVAKNIVLLDSLKPRIHYGSYSDDFLGALFRKRKRSSFDDSDDSEVTLPKRIRNASAKVFHQITGCVSSGIPRSMSVMLNQVMLEPPLFLKFGSEQLSFKLKEAGTEVGEADMKTIALRMVPKRLMISESNLELDLPSRLFHDRHLKRSISVNAPYCPEDAKQCSLLSANSGVVNDASRVTSIAAIGCERFSEDREKEQLAELDSLTRKETLSPTLDTALIDIPLDKESNRTVSSISGGNELTYNKDPITMNVNDRALSSETELSVANKLLRKTSSKKDFCHRDGIDSKQQARSKFLGRHQAFSTPKDQQHRKRDSVSVIVGLKAIQNQNDVHIKDQKGNSTSLSPKDQAKPKVLPNFESYIVEEEEGSGGYGTVYRARRKSDGTIVAIKCPHANANKHHVNNELRMLERFGGKNFVIKYQGCFKIGDSDCFVLEHVKHDRPEVLKKEIDISEIQWYGYCMFRALASLHKQGIVHRDVKPGNFLFSRKAAKGYLIDFNLAMDLHSKYGIINKSKVGNDISLNHVTPSAKYMPHTNSRKAPSAKPLAAVKQEETKGSNSTLEHKNLKRKAAGQTKAGNDLSGWSMVNSQGADGSGITSAKDVTSTKTPSAERLREPLPCHGRKELISLLQQAMQSPNHQTLHFPAPMRKRIAAPPGKVDKELMYLTPMPLHSSGIAVAGAGLRNKGNAKNNKEGPCAGTKGFRAPEVLFRSQHQGPKVDIWSAGVTLLYLMIGRAPFFGDPEQNIKGIVKLRGSEEVWEVAKLHNRESSFPEDLYDTQSLAPMNLREWCKMNTKRPDFLEVIPSSLFDLVDKCLTVNPRLRLSAEDALKHEFFAPCHESLKKHRLLRQGLALDNTTVHQSQKQSIAGFVKSSG